MRHTVKAVLIAALVAVAIGAAVPRSALADTVGTAGAANTVSTGTPPGQSVRTIEIGTQIVRNEKIATSNSGSVQVVFIDKTTLNIGPNSTLVIDQFVFNPAEGTGKLTLTLGKGLLRIVGGQATHTGGATVNTPVAVVGIRGAIATLSYCGAPTCSPSGLRVTNHFGEITVTAHQGTQTISRPGFTLTVDASGQMPDAPFRAAQADVDRDNASLTSRGAQTGGSHIAPTDGLAVRQGLGAVNAALNPSLSVPRQSQTSAGVGQHGNPLLYRQAQTALNTQLIQTAVAQPAGVQTAAANRLTPAPPPNTVPVPAPTPGPGPAPIPTLPPLAYALTTTVDSASLGQSQVPYLQATFVGQGNWHVSKILGYRAGGPEPNIDTGTQSRLLQAGININGSGAAQNSGIFLMTSTVAHDDKFGWTLFGGIDAFSRSSSNSRIVRAAGAVSSVENTASPTRGLAIDGNLLPTGSFPINQNSFTSSNSSNVHYYSNAQTGDNTGHTYGYNQTFARIATPAGLGTDHPNETLQGYVGGVMQTTTYAPLNSNGRDQPAFVVTNSSGSPGDVSVTLLGTSSRFGATFNVVNSTPTTAEPFKSGTFNFGDLNANDNSVRGASINSHNFGARSEQTFTVSNGQGVETETTLINGQNAIQTNNDSLHMLMVTSDTVLGTSSTNHTSSLFPGVTFCSCDYTRWGFWSARSYQQNSANTSGNAVAGNLMTWVAGLPAGAANIPTVGSATYTGNVVASIANNGAQYVSASNFSNTVNFATGRGAVSVPNLDGSSYSGSVALSAANRALLGGTIQGSAARTLTLNGSFFNSATSPYGEMGGSATLKGTNYLGGGIFVAHGK